ncbi:rhamnulokinase [Niveibacterium sp. SC-1]|uniref:rhamnulokinase n=1 Tax=Niveibacterium sp. SC-1 TaxID=3135646 RepID=UPI00311D9231
MDLFMGVEVVAVDLGASSGRVVLARYLEETGGLVLQEVHRFENGFVQRAGQDCWDLERLSGEIVFGLEKTLAGGARPVSVGIDTWGVDFVLLDAEDRPLGEAVAYRDHRTDGVMERVFARVPRDEIYRRTGIQFLQFNSLYQLVALQAASPERLAQARTLMFVPDYLHYRLCGVKSCEYTNASTSQLLNLEAGGWDRELMARLALPDASLQPLCAPGTRLGEWGSREGHRLAVIAPATHDTASAVIGTPLEDEHSLYISSGTWSLMGIESRTPFNDAQALAANFTNEGGTDGRFRVLKNIMGLWLIQRLRDAFPHLSHAELVTQAEAAPSGSLVDPNDARFLNPPSMADAIRAFCAETGQATPQSAGEFARCVFESLACLYRQTLDELRAITRHAITGNDFRRIHIVGGGSQNAFLNQLCADFCGLPVSTGPVEASALGNVGCQLRALGHLADLPAIRALVRENFAGQDLHPRADATQATLQQWRRFHELRSRSPAASPRTPEGAVP